MRTYLLRSSLSNVSIQFEVIAICATLQSANTSTNSYSIFIRIKGKHISENLLEIEILQTNGYNNSNLRQVLKFAKPTVVSVLPQPQFAFIAAGLNF